MRSDVVDLGIGTPVTREYVDHPGAVGIVALRNTEGKPEVLLLRQYRHPIRSNLWEIPAGLLDIEGESYLAAAQRELAEEADLQAREWNVLVDYFTTPGGSNESLRIFLAQDITEVPEEARYRREEEEALMESVWVPLEEAVDGILQGKFHNPSTCVGILSLYAATQRGLSNLRAADSFWMR